jgi:hypothetical protein
MSSLFLVTVGGNATNSGQIYLDWSAPGTSPFKVNGDFTNTGQVIQNEGRMEVTGSFNNSGDIVHGGILLVGGGDFNNSGTYNGSSFNAFSQINGASTTAAR